MKAMEEKSINRCAGNQMSYLNKCKNKALAAGHFRAFSMQRYVLNLEKGLGMGRFQTYLTTTPYTALTPDKKTQNPWSAEQSTGNVEGEPWKSQFPRTSGLSGGADVDTEV